MKNPSPSIEELKAFAVVRLRRDLPRGTIMEVLDENTVLVEFSDESGVAIEVVPVDRRLLSSIREEASPNVGVGDDACRRRIGIAKGKFELPDETPNSGYPRDETWENMPDVGLEKWPDYSEEDGEK